jgi:glycosyltransferase involved in cell wall biosynthesis
VLVLATTVPARRGDGTPEFVLLLARALASDYEITIVCPRVRDAEREEIADGVRIVRFPYFLRRWEGLADGAILQNLRRQRWRAIEIPFLLVAFVAATLRTARSFGADLIHAHWILPAGFIALVGTKFHRVPFVVTAHGVDVFGLRSRPFLWLKRRVMRRASIVSPASKEMAQVLGMEPGEIDDLVVPMGVEADDIAAAVGEPMPEAGRFLFVGRLAEKKGVDVLLRAVAQVPEARLRVAGDGPDDEALRRLASELGIGDRVQFLGRRTRAEVFAELKLAHALVVPSRVARDGDADSTPLVMSEAMAAGVPVVASRLGGLAEQITTEENGLLVEPDSVESLGEGLHYVLDNPERARGWTELARDRMRTSLDIEHTRARYLEFYRRALEGR